MGNRSEPFSGCAGIEAFLKRKCERELEYRLIKDLSSRRISRRENWFRDVLPMILKELGKDVQIRF